MDYQSQFQEKTNEELFAEYKMTGEQAIKQELVLRYVYIVKNIAIQMRGVYLDFAQLDDIVNEGVLALMTAIDKFSLDKNVKFETYISKRIRGLIIDIARQNDWVPRSVRKNAKEIDNATNYLFTKLGRMPNDQEIATHLDISLEKYKQELGKTNLINVLSLETFLEDNGARKRSNQMMITNYETMPEEYLQNSELRRTMKKGLESLRKNEQMVISLYYKHDLSMKEIAGVLNVSEPRISQIHANAIRKFRIYMERIMNEDK